MIYYSQKSQYVPLCWNNLTARGMGRRFQHFVCSFLLFFPSVCFSFNFTPTDSEWNSWPSYCRARYVGTTVGMNSKFYSPYYQAEDKRLTSSLGQRNFRTIHHYCAGVIWLNRSKFSTDENKKRAYLSKSIEEIEFTTKSMKVAGLEKYKKFQLLPIINSNLARAYYVKGEKSKALDLLDKTISYQQNQSAGYITLSEIYKKDGDIDSAKNILLEGYKKVGENSLPLNVYLAHIYIDDDNISEARKYAKKAYSLGYNLPWLKDKLKLE